MDLFYSKDEGNSWLPCEGLPHLTTHIDTFQIFISNDDTAYCVANETQLYRSIDYGVTWELAFENLSKIYSLTN